jgi:hypothetical protein
MTFVFIRRFATQRPSPPNADALGAGAPAVSNVVIAISARIGTAPVKQPMAGRALRAYPTARPGDVNQSSTGFIRRYR